MPEKLDAKPETGAAWARGEAAGARSSLVSFPLYGLGPRLGGRPGTGAVVVGVGGRRDQGCPDRQGVVDAGAAQDELRSGRAAPLATGRGPAERRRAERPASQPRRP